MQIQRSKCHSGEHSTTTGSSGNIHDLYVNYLQAGDIILGWELTHPDDTSTNWIKFEPRRVEEITNTDLQGHLIRVHSETNNIVFIADTGSPTSFVNEKTANLLSSTVKSAVKTKLGEDDEAKRMVCYKGYKIPSLGRLSAPIESGGWNIQTASFIVVDDRRANIMGRNLFPQIGIQLHQERKPIGKSKLQSTILTVQTHKQRRGSELRTQAFVHE